jgi:hypothetical protein
MSGTRGFYFAISFPLVILDKLSRTNKDHIREMKDILAFFSLSNSLQEYWREKADLRSVLEVHF